MSLNQTAPRLEDHLADPLSGAALKPQGMPGSGQALVSVQDGRAYPMVQGVYNMVPDPLPLVLAQKAVLWRKLQDNGLQSYRAAPFLNLFATGGGLARDFADFLDIKGLVLEVGCGPQRNQPAYITSSRDLTYWGLDPLLGEQPRDFTFVLGMGELLPFADATFDGLVYCSCLDHMIDFHRALEQGARVLKPNGSLHLALDFMETQNLRSPVRDKISRGMAQALQGFKRNGLFWTMRYVVQMALLKTPPGAVDQFHLHFPTIEAVKTHLDKCGFLLTAEERRADMVFLRALKGA